MTADELADRIALKVLERLMAMTDFPNAEDVERIRDHVSPNGVAYKNGKKDERARIVQYVHDNWGDLEGIVELIDDGRHWE